MASVASVRGARNARAILDAAAEELADRGWGSLLPARVAKRAGLSVTPVRNRFGDRAGLATGLWNDGLAEHLLALLQGLIDVLDVTSPEEQDAALASALAPFIHAQPRTRSAVELLIVAMYEPAVAEAVHASMDARFAHWLTPRDSGVTDVAAAQGALLLSTALGFVLVQGLPSLANGDYSEVLHHIGWALRHPAKPTRLPTTGVGHFDRGFVFGTTSAAWDSLLRATLDTVSEVGYEAATVERIARRCGFTQGLVFSRYPNKHELFLDATRRATATAMELNSDMMQRIQRSRTVGIGEAVYIREVLRPIRRKERVVLLEQLRLSMHDPIIARAIDDSHVWDFDDPDSRYPGSTPEHKWGFKIHGLALGQGPALLPEYAPEVWTLPFDVFMVPFERGVE